MTRSALSGRVYSVVVWAGFLAMLTFNLPGHLTYDSVAQLHEGRIGVRETWGPAFYAWLLGVCDKLVTGTKLYVVISGLVLFASLASLPALRRRASWWGVFVALFVVLTPHILIGQAIVWKDIAFANAAVAGMVCLAHADREWAEPRRRWLYLILSLVLFAVAAQLRQNGLLAGLFAAGAVGWIASRGSLRRGAIWGVAAAVSFMIATQAIGMASVAALKPNPDAPPGSGVGFGVRLIQGYDLAGAVSRDPDYDLTVIEKTLPKEADLIEANAPALYSAQRIDFLDRDPALGAAMLKPSNALIRDQWLDLVVKHPGLYLLVRAGDFRWLVAPPVIDRCLPISVGIDVAPAVLEKVDIAPRKSRDDLRLYNYTTWFLDTPVYSHITYILLALGLAVALIRRQHPGDIPVAVMQLGSLAFAASFFVISVACDWRYLYYVDLTAMVGLIYFALDPSMRLPRETVRQEPAPA